MSIGVTEAVVLAAGLGTRMRPLTLTKPKPLVEVQGKALIDYGLEKLVDAGIQRVVVNTHYLPGQIVAWARAQKTPEILISDETREILDTGGGVLQALALLRETPVFVLNSDSFWIDGTIPALERLKAAWRDDAMDVLLLLSPLDRTVGYDGAGDFILDAAGRLVRRRDGVGEPLAYSGAYLMHPRVMKGAPGGKFSMNVLWDRAIADGRLYGLSHDGLWLHVGTPESIVLAENALRHI